MAGFSLRGGGGGGGGASRPGSDRGGDHHHPIGADSLFLYARGAAAAAADTAGGGGGSGGGIGFQLWHPHHQAQAVPHTSQFFSSGSGGVATGVVLGFSPHDAHAAGGVGAGGGRAGTSCQDCGNNAKKDCTHQRCRTCCRSRGFSCPTHVKSTWVPASKRRERQQQLLALAASAAMAGPSSGDHRDPSKRPRARISRTTPTTSSGDQQMVTVAERFPREVSSEAVFRCVRLGPVDVAEAELAYQTTVSIGGHVFKGILHDVGANNAAAGASAAAVGGGSGDYQFRLTGDVYPPSSAAAAGGDAAGGGNVVVSSAVVMDPYPTPGLYGSFPAGAPFFHGHPRQ